MAVDDKKKYAYNYLIGKGLSPIAAAGIVGNLVAESGLNTTIPGRADDKGSIGIAQWHSDRKQGLMTFANKVNKPFSSLSTQLDYLVYELKSPAYSKALAGLNFAKTPGEASIAFMNHYEKPAEWAKKQSVGKRVGEATSIYTGKPYEGVNYSEDSEETFRDPNLDFDYNRNPTGATYTEEELEEAEAETAKQELLQKQKEKDFIAEVQSKEYAPQQQQDIPQEQAPQIDASLYEMPQIALPEYGNTQLPTMQFGGFAEVGKIIKDFEKAKAANKDRNKFLIKDTRKISATTGKPLNPNSDIVTGKYDKSVIRNLALAASKHYADPYTSVAVGLQESKLGTTDDNIGHIIGKHDTKFTGSEEEDLVRVLQDKLKYAKDLGIEDEATMIQAYNGLGKIFPQTEKRYHGFEMKKIYGVPVPKSGIDMKKTPLYGKRVIDLRDNVIKKNPEVVRYIENLPKYNHFSGKYEEKFNPLPMLNYEEGGETGGKITCSNCGWSWDKSESSQEDMYNCHKCGGTHGEESKYQEGGDTFSKYILKPGARLLVGAIHGADNLVDKAFHYMKPNGLEQETREDIFRRFRPTSYPTMAQAAIDYFAKNDAKPGRDKQGDYDVAEEAWRKALDLPTKSKYVTESKYKPTTAKDKNAKYYTLNNIIDPNKITEYVKSREGKKGDKFQMDALTPYMRDDVNLSMGNKNTDPLQNFQISVGEDEKGKYAAIYDKYDFDSLKAANRVIKPYEIYDRYYYKEDGGYQYPKFNKHKKFTK